MKTHRIDKSLDKQQTTCYKLCVKNFLDLSEIASLVAYMHFKSGTEYTIQYSDDSLDTQHNLFWHLDGFINRTPTDGKQTLTG